MNLSTQQITQNRAARSFAEPARKNNGPRLRGTILRYNRAHGYGFVQSGDQKYFLHCSQLLFVELPNDQMEGLAVTFIADRNVKDGKQPLAKAVQIDEAAKHARL